MTSVTAHSPLPVSRPVDARHPRVTVWFDGGCVLCRSEIALYQRLDRARGRVAFVDLTGGETDAAACPLDRAELLARFHARDEIVGMVSGAAAFGALWRQVTPFQPLGHLMRVPIVLAATEALYRQFLRIRPGLQRWLAKGAIATRAGEAP